MHSVTLSTETHVVADEGDPPPPPEQIGPWHFPAEAAPFFQEVASLRYPFDVVYNNSRDYLDILATQSGTRALGRARSEDFLGRVRDRLHSLGSPQLTATFVGYLTIGRRTPSPGGASADGRP